MRVAALYDIHANLPALEAVLRDVRAAGVDQVIVGGDVVPGPMPCEALDCLLHLDLPVQFLQGNGELAVLAQIAAPTPDAVTYWGTGLPEPPPEPIRQVLRWTAQRLLPDFPPRIARWPKAIRQAIDGLGEVLFCHATPRSETEVFTRRTPEAVLLPLFEGLEASVVVCGHTHMPFDRRVGKTRVVNAGSVGMPFGEPGACWALLGPGIELRRTPYDLARAAERIQATPYPQAQQFARDSVLNPPAEAQMLDAFDRAAGKRSDAAE